VNYLHKLALNCHLPGLCFLSSYNYKREPPVPGLYSVFCILLEGRYWVLKALLSDEFFPKLAYLGKLPKEIFQWGTGGPHL
jgi:hypothetical protein